MGPPSAGKTALLATLYDHALHPRTGEELTRIQMLQDVTVQVFWDQVVEPFIKSSKERLVVSPGNRSRAVAAGGSASSLRRTPLSDWVRQLQAGGLIHSTRSVTLYEPQHPVITGFPDLAAAWDFVDTPGLTDDNLEELRTLMFRQVIGVGHGKDVVQQDMAGRVLVVLPLRAADLRQESDSVDGMSALAAHARRCATVLGSVFNHAVARWRANSCGVYPAWR